MMIYFPMTCGLRIECLPAPPSCTRHVCVLYSVELTLKLEVALDEAGAIHTRARNIRNHRCTPTAATMSEPNLECDACLILYVRSWLHHVLVHTNRALLTSPTLAWLRCYLDIGMLPHHKDIGGVVHMHGFTEPSSCCRV